MRTHKLDCAVTISARHDCSCGEEVRPSQDWVEDSLHWRGKVLVGKYAHWCPDWDDLPIDETCREWPCTCEFELRWY